MWGTCDAGAAMAKNDRLMQWWNGLSDDERNAFLAAQTNGTMTDKLRRSLERAGLVQNGAKGTAIPGGVNEFLKMRH